MKRKENDIDGWASGVRKHRGVGRFGAAWGGYLVRFPGKYGA